MSLLEDIKTLERLFEQAKESYLVVEPKTPLDILREELPQAAKKTDNATGFVGWGDVEDFPRDEKAIKENRDWILEETDKRYAPSPGDYSPYDRVTYDGIIKWMQEARPAGGQSAWVAYATQELERTGARRAIPAGFKEYRSFLTEKDTIYVAAPPQ